MKKILAVLVAMVLLASITIPAFAADEDPGIPLAESASPEVLNSTEIKNLSVEPTSPEVLNSTEIKNLSVEPTNPEVLDPVGFENPPMEPSIESKTFPEGTTAVLNYEDGSAVIITDTEYSTPEDGDNIVAAEVVGGIDLTINEDLEGVEGQPALSVTGTDADVVVAGQVISVTEPAVSLNESTDNIVIVEEAILAGKADSTAYGILLNDSNGNLVRAEDLVFSEDGLPLGIYYSNGNDVIIQGDIMATEDQENFIPLVSSSDNYISCAQDVSSDIFIDKASTGNVFVIEGTLTGDINSDATDNAIYIGKLDGTAVTEEVIRFLFGTSVDSLEFSEMNIVADTLLESEPTYSSVIVDENGQLIQDKTYRLTRTMDQLAGAKISLAPIEEGKEIIVGELPAGITAETIDGITTLLIDNTIFRGGAQNLYFALKDIIEENPEVAAEVIAYYAPMIQQKPAPLAVSLVQTDANGNPLDASATSGITTEDINGHISVRFSTEFMAALSDFDSLTISNQTTGDPIPKAAYSIYTHNDGSVSIILSNTYLQSLEPDIYEFLFTVDGTDFVLTLDLTA